MDYFDDDYFSELYEFQIQFNALKETLITSAKQEIQDELNKLREENESLKEFRDKKENYEKELKAIKERYEIDVQKAERKALEKRLADVFSSISTTGYKIKPEVTHLYPKCNKCDEKRKFHFTSPMGKPMIEDCECSTTTVAYSPVEVRLVAFGVNKDIFELYYKDSVWSHEYYDSYENVHSFIYDFMKNKSFESLLPNKNSIVFFKKEDCERFCEWLNERNKNEIN